MYHNNSKVLEQVLLKNITDISVQDMENIYDEVTKEYDKLILSTSEEQKKSKESEDKSKSSFSNIEESLSSTSPMLRLTTSLQITILPTINTEATVATKAASASFSSSIGPPVDKRKLSPTDESSAQPQEGPLKKQRVKDDNSSTSSSLSERLSSITSAFSNSGLSGSLPTDSVSSSSPSLTFSNMASAVQIGNLSTTSSIVTPNIISATADPVKPKQRNTNKKNDDDKDDTNTSTPKL